tara:strand:+ start:336 stop:548 length:213 start_codon:yes stop_codon:yes gene_type:complete
MASAILGGIIAALATTGLVIAVESVERAFRNAGRYPLTNNEIKILQSAGLNSETNIIILNTELKVMPQKL